MPNWNCLFRSTLNLCKWQEITRWCMTFWHYSYDSWCCIVELPWSWTLYAQHNILLSNQFLRTTSIGWYLGYFPLAIQGSVWTIADQCLKDFKTSWIACMRYFSRENHHFVQRQSIFMIFVCLAVVFSCTGLHLYYSNDM